jgi:hypothetical protein
VQEVPKSIKCVPDNVKIIVAHFKRSTIASHKLLSHQKSQGAAVPKKLIPEVPTRWNSTFHMLKRITELKDEVKTSIAQKTRIYLCYQKMSGKICLNLTEILKPFEEVTAQLNGEQYETGSQMTVITRGLISIYGKLLKDNINPALNQVIKDLLSGINSN